MADGLLRFLAWVARFSGAAAIWYGAIKGHAAPLPVDWWPPYVGLFVWGIGYGWTLYHAGYDKGMRRDHGAPE